MRSGAITVLGVYYRGQDANCEPDHYWPLDQCKRAKAAGQGTFINRNKAFRRFDVSTPHDTKRYNASGRRGESLRVNLALMDRFVEGERYAVAAVNSWCSSPKGNLT